MDYLNTLGFVALGSRLKRLSDRLNAEIAEIYRDAGLEFEPRWFPLFRMLAERGPTSVGEAAHRLGLSHASVSQIAAAMSRRGVIDALPDATDERRRVLSLTRSGQQLLPRLAPVWAQLGEALRGLTEPACVDLLSVLDDLEAALEARSLGARIAGEATRAKHVEIFPYVPEHRDAFRDLNVEWLERFFRVEPIDAEVLGDPERHVLAGGGSILFARVEGHVVGTCALIRESAERIELSKMAVTEKYQGRGIGRRLILRAIRVARELGAETLFLVTNSRMTPAVSLYHDVGFITTFEGQDPKYERGDVQMELPL